MANLRVITMSRDDKMSRISTNADINMSLGTENRLQKFLCRSHQKITNLKYIYIL